MSNARIDRILMPPNTLPETITQLRELEVEDPSWSEKEFATYTKCMERRLFDFRLDIKYAELFDIYQRVCAKYKTPLRAAS